MQAEGEAYQGSWGRDAAAQLFLDAGCPDGATDNNSCSALHYAAGAPAVQLNLCCGGHYSSVHLHSFDLNSCAQCSPLTVPLQEVPS